MSTHSDKVNSKSANLSLQVVPINTPNAYPIIDQAIHTIQQSGVKHEVQAFATLMEGELAELVKVTMQAKDAALEAGANELILNIQIHLKKDSSVTLAEKVVKFKD